MQDLAELHRSSRPAMTLSDLGKPKASSPKNQVCPPASTWHSLENSLNTMNGISLSHPLSSRGCWCVVCVLQNDVRVKFEFKGEKRILQFFRPVRLDDLGNKAKVAFGQAMDLHYTNNEVLITITSSPSHSGAGRYTVFYNRPVLMPRLVLVLT